ncbi:MAG TPA: hypothetical protein H9754_07445 [Candidatus Anaerostipes avistercoris]|uniref:Uncharacterized protein n=1 Tax=Candidatus Anaerostipes avistercoris TaxID=2838462 RepID=A0A9D2T9K9_9FIRM|nr:DUF6514 family protein [uncultured Anaerostipes sp.]HJC50386.1 hypothetical protein [Candidatus Anaerostipes avistercoris]
MKRKKETGRRVFLDDKERENVVSYYLMEDQAKGIYGVAVEKCRIEEGVIEWDSVPHLSYSREDARKMTERLMEYCVTPVSLAEAVDTIMWMEDEDGGTVI